MIVERLAETVQAGAEKALWDWFQGLQAEGTELHVEQFRRLSSRLLPQVRAQIDSVKISEAFAGLGLEEAFVDSLRLLGMAVDANIPHHLGHSARVARGVRILAMHMRLSDDLTNDLEQAAGFHDVGMVALGAELCSQRRRLRDHEQAVLQRHPRILVSMLRPTGLCQRTIPIVLHHHENWDGTGYPAGLKETAIPIGARVLKLIDVFDALISPRPHRVAYSVEDAQYFVQRKAGKDFDPEVVQAFNECSELIEILVRGREDDTSGPPDRQRI